MVGGGVVPPGIFFLPKDEEAVQHYLLPRLLGERLPLEGLILDDDPLSAPPWELLERNGRKDDAFFFAEGQAKSGKDTRQNRACAGGGSWKGQRANGAGDKLQARRGLEISWKRYALNFHGGGGKKGSTGWVLQEYAIVAPEELAASRLRLYRVHSSRYGKKRSDAMELAPTIGLPPGFGFAPDDEDAVAHYLLPRIVGQIPPLDGLIVSDDPLSAPPWDLLKRNGRKEDAFFFAEAQAKSGKGARQKRTCVGGGSWYKQKKFAKGEKLPVPGPDGVLEVGWGKSLLSFSDGGDDKGSTGWVMHEYAITSPDHLAASASGSAATARSARGATNSIRAQTARWQGML